MFATRMIFLLYHIFFLWSLCFVAGLIFAHFFCVHLLFMLNFCTWLLRWMILKLTSLFLLISMDFSALVPYCCLLYSIVMSIGSLMCTKELGTCLFFWYIPDLYALIWYTYGICCIWTCFYIHWCMLTGSYHATWTCLVLLVHYTTVKLFFEFILE